MLDEHEREFDIHRMVGPKGMLIWIQNVLSDIEREADDPEFVKTHASDLQEAVCEVFQRLGGEQ